MIVTKNAVYLNILRLLLLTNLAPTSSSVNLISFFMLTFSSFSDRIGSVKFFSASLLVIISIGLFPSYAFSEGKGRTLYIENCSSCHGKGGEGLKAPALRKEGLLRTVTLDYFTGTMLYGRPLLGCPSFNGRLASLEIEDIASYIKSWQEGEQVVAPSHAVSPLYTQRGERHFILCGGCHGPEGEGAMAPPLLDAGLLSSISDGELRGTIMWGRPGTPMKGYLKGMGGLAVLSPDEIDELISYMRFRQNKSK